MELRRVWTESTHPFLHSLLRSAPPASHAIPNYRYLNMDLLIDALEHPENVDITILKEI